MSNQENYETDYEDMDDLQLSERIEWKEIRDSEIFPDDVEEEPSDYDTEYGSLNFDQKEW